MYSYLVFLLVISFLSVNNCNAMGLGGRKILKKEYIIYDVHSLFSPSCKPSIHGQSRPASLKVTHKYTHCSTSGQNNSYIEPNLAELLAHDQIRVASIQKKRQAFNTKSNIEEDLAVSKATLSAQPDGGAYVVQVGLGTPTKLLTLEFDTGSSLTWTQCQPCTIHCYSQKDSVFNPSSSTSYSNTSCSSSQCTQLPNLGYGKSCSRESTCLYAVNYGDKSYSAGYLANERLTLTPNDVFDNFPIGCGENNTGFTDVAGILGLGSDYYSVVSQTAGKYGKYFSYCLPTQSGSNGHLTFGKGNGAPENIVFTPLVNDPLGGFYIVNTIAINVGDTQFTFHSGLTIIDSGTTFTQLPAAVYATIRDAFKQQMAEYTLAQSIFPFDTCYDLSNANPKGSITAISFIFEGNQQVELGLEQMFVSPGRSIVCLAFTPTNKNIAIFGNWQQQTLQVVYDVAGGRLGFGSGGCS